MQVAAHNEGGTESAREFRDVVEEDGEIMKHLNEKDIDYVFGIDAHFADVDRTFRALGL